MSATLLKIRSYYDENIDDKLRDFVEGNERVERAWLTLEQWAPLEPWRILEIGCGIGQVAARLSKRWPGAEVIGVDVSPRSLEIARNLFAAPRLHFVEGPLRRGMLTGPFDLVVLLDVYEHIAPEDRRELHDALAGLLHMESTTMLSFPTPAALAWSRKFYPETVQPIDEDISLHIIQALAHDLGSHVLLYQEVDIWHECDYAHAVLGLRKHMGPPRRMPKKRGVFSRIRHNVSSGAARSHRLALVQDRLGQDAYPG